MKTRINADDFGISLGVNMAVEKMFQSGKLNSASIICGCGFFDDAIKIAKRNPNLKIGLHFNLSVGKPTSPATALQLLASNNKFKHGFLNLLLLSLFAKKKLQKEVAIELENQLDAIEKHGIKINHIDSHRHIHMIPAIFSIVAEIAAKRQIEHLRIINENLFTTTAINHEKNFLYNGGLVKWLVLRSFAFINKFFAQKKLQNFKKSYFFSILYTCQIGSDLISKIKVPNAFKNADELEIMIHPGSPETDKNFDGLEERPHLLSPNRNLEAQN